MKYLCRILVYAVTMLSANALGVVVHVYEAIEIAGSVTTNCDVTVETGTNYIAVAAGIEGYKFTHWSISTKQEFSCRDFWGRATEASSFTVYEETLIIAHYLPNEEDTDEDGVADGDEIYWKGDLSWDGNSDADGDGIGFTNELVQGTNPYFKDEVLSSGVLTGESNELEVNLQVYDQPVKLLVDGELKEFWTSKYENNNLTSENFGAFSAPAVMDYDGDGLFDLLIAMKNNLRIYHNVGCVATPNFIDVTAEFPILVGLVATMERPIISPGNGCLYFSDDKSLIHSYDFASNTVVKFNLAGAPAWCSEFGICALQNDGSILSTNGILSLNEQIVEGLSVSFADINRDGHIDLLASDCDGRVWFFAQDAGNFILQNKVWGGSSPGFANGLVIATVDWEDDGDIDALCGTKEGKIIMLRNPRSGRPTSVVARAGYSNVTLEWDPDYQSRTHGYHIYRADDVTKEFKRLTNPYVRQPNYRDEPEIITNYRYRVTSVSRFYKAGNPTPEVFESAPSDVVSATLGSVVLTMPEEMISADHADIDLPLSINNSMGVAWKGLDLKLTFDPMKLTGIKPATTALLSSGLFIQSNVDHEKGEWTVKSLDGDMTPGSGVMLSFRFAVKEGAYGETMITLASASLESTNGVPITVDIDGVKTKLKVPTPEKVEEMEKPDEEDSEPEPEEPSPEPEPNKPIKVLPWQNGDCDGNKRLDWEDYKIGKRVIMENDGVLLNGGSDKKIYRSIQQALGLNKNDVLELGKHLPLFYHYILKHFGEGKKTK